MKNRLIAFGFLFALLFQTGCATILTRKAKQRVTVVSGTNDVEIALGGSKLSQTGNSAVFKIRKGKCYTTEVSRDGFKTRVDVIDQHRFNGVTLLNIPFCFFPPMVLAFLIDVGNKNVRNFPKELKVEELAEIVTKEDAEKFIWIQRTGIHLNSSDTIARFYKSDRKAEKDRPLRIFTAREKVNVTDSDFSEMLNDLLHKYDFSSNGENVVPNYWNSLYVDSKVTDFSTNIVELQNGFSYFFSTLGIEWTFYDGFGNKLFTTTTSSKSDPVLHQQEYSYSGDGSIIDDVILRTINDALDYALLDVLNNEELKGHLQIESFESISSRNPETQLELKFNENPNSFEENLESVVKVESEDHLSSGVIVSSDGYIITSFEVVSTEAEVNVFIDGEEHIAKIVATNGRSNLALIKVERNNLIAIEGISSNEVSQGDEVYAMAYTSIEELDRYVSKGIISGLRADENSNYYQTDVSMSSGNIGGLLTNEAGVPIGILNSSYNSVLNDGVGFAIPFEEALELLKIKVKD